VDAALVDVGSCRGPDSRKAVFLPVNRLVTFSAAIER
jgi:hypothetical protein